MKSITIISSVIKLLHLLIFIFLVFEVVTVNVNLLSSNTHVINTSNNDIIMVALCNRADHYIFMLFLSLFPLA